MKISILGCGWLGLPLAKELLKNDHAVKGSTTTPWKLAKLSSEGIKSFLISVSSEGISGDFSSFLDDADVLIIDFPPGLKKNPDLNYSKAIKKLVVELERQKIQKVIFVSSISVFQDDENFPEYSEESIPNGNSKAAQQLISAEELLQNADVRTVIIRFGGLLGKERHPVKQLSGRKDVKNPKAPVNLIQLVDCIAIILKIIEKDHFRGIFHGVNPAHPKKEAYYTKKATEFNLFAPQFDQKSTSSGKIIASTKLQKELNFSFEIKI